MRCAEHLQRLLAVALPVRDVLEQRIDTPHVPAWCEARGWAPFLLGLQDDTLAQAEAYGLAALLPTLPHAPESLTELARAVTHATALPMLRGATPLGTEALRSVRFRKRAQLSALLSAVADMAEQAERIVDVGAGSGHFTRLSADLFERDAVGLEHNPARVESARKRAQTSARASFVSVDAREALGLTAHDLAIGLHACGELGDKLIAAAAAAQCDLALVSCCLQKISTPERTPLSRAVVTHATLRREHLGLTNLTAQPQGVEASIDVTIAARQTRYALGQLLRARGVVLEPGAEMSGITRRRANAGLAVVAQQGLALRDLPPPSDAELAHHRTLAEQHYAVIRRLSLPRSMLARLIEVLVSLDRAAHLEEQGLNVQVATLFERAVSPRNIGIFASQSGQRLPAA